MTVSAQGRLRPAGNVRLWITAPDGLVHARGRIIDVSDGGCRLRLHRGVDVQLAGRISVEIAGKESWLPVVTRWAHEDTHGWTVGCTFDRPTNEQAHAIRALLSERRRMVPGSTS